MQLQGESTQRGVRHMHADQRASRQQKRQHIAQVQLVVDAAQQQDQQCHAQQPSGAGRQDVDRALGQHRGVGRRDAVQEEALPAAAGAGDLKGSGTLHRYLRVA